jgi:hypothetical protein
MLFHLIIKGLSATTGGVGRESVDRIAARNNKKRFKCNSVSGETEEHAQRLRVAGVLLKLPGQICACRSQEWFSEQICVGLRLHHIGYRCG